MALVSDGEGAQAVFLARISREGNGRNMPAAKFLQRAQFLHQRVAVFPRHTDVGDEYFWPPFVTGGQCLRRRGCGPHLCAAPRERHGHNFTRIGFVIHKQRAYSYERGRIWGLQAPTRRVVAKLIRRHARSRAAGNATVKVAPLPSPSLATRTVPPCSSTIWRTMESPSPNPPCGRFVPLFSCRKRSKT